MSDASDTAGSESGGPVSPQVTSTIASITEYLNRPKAKSKPKKAQKSGKKRSQEDDPDLSDDDDESGPMEPFFAAARWIPLSIDPFLNLRDVFMEGLKAISLRPFERAQMTNDQQYKTVVFQKIMQLVPGFPTLVSDFRTNLATYNIFIKQMSNKMSTTRSNVMSGIKKEVPNHIPPDDQSRPFYVLPDVRSKHKWGWNHPVTARQLCPMRLVAEFERDPASFQAGVQEGRHRVTAADFPAFLYDEDQYKLNPEDPRSGLFQGHVLLRGYRHIFTGPASWEDGKGEGGKQARAIVNKLKAPTPQTIAYAAIMIRWALSSAQGWERKDMQFDYNDFFQAILITLNADIEADMGVSEVDEETAEWLANTLLWWKEKTPALRLNNTANVASEELQDEQSDLFKLKAMRKGKLKASIPIDPRLSQQAPEEPREEPEPRPLPRPIPHPATPALPEEPMEPRPRPATPALPEEPMEPLRPQPRPVTRHAAPTSLPQDDLSSEPSHHAPSSAPPPSDSPPTSARPEDENPQLQSPPGEPRCPPPDSDTSSTSSRKRPNRPCAEGDKVPDAPTGTVAGFNNPAFDGPLSPVASPGPKKKKTRAKANVNSEPQTTTNETRNKRVTRQQVKKSTRKQF